MVYLIFIVSWLVRFKKWTIFGLAQDFFVALEISLLPRFLAIPVASVALLYTVFDAMLFKRLRTRMHPSYFVFFRQGRSFLDSAIALGLKTFIGFACALLAVITFMPPLFFSWDKVIALLVLGGIGFKGSSYKSDNAFFFLQFYFLSYFRKRKSKIFELPTFLVPPGEKAEYLSPMFPLLKKTRGFEGVKQFNIDLQEESPHVVFLVLESFRAKDVNFRVTPCFERVKKEGIYFSQFYSNGVLTHQSVISTLFGIYPFFGSLRNYAIFDEPVHKVDFSTLPLVGIPDLLKQKGYKTAYIDAALSLESEKQFFKDHGFETVIGRDNFSSKETTSWGVYDRKLFEYAIEWLEKEIPKEHPLFSVIFTISNHHPWQTPEDYTLDSFVDSKDEVYRKFLRTMRYTDHCLEGFLDALKEKELDRNLILFVMGDHGQGMGEHGLERFQNTVYEENIHVPLLILAPGKIKEPLEITTTSSQIDLLPTLIDLLKLNGVNHAMGRSLLRERSSPIFYNNSHIGFSLGCRHGPYKYIYSNLLNMKKEFFDIANDPEEKHNLYTTLPQTAQSYEKMTNECYQFMYALYERGNFTLSAKQMVDCSGLRDITDEKLQKLLQESSQPHTLNLSGCLCLTDHSLKTLIPYALNLRRLDLTDCLFSHEALERFLKRVPHLENLKLKNCPLLSLEEVERLRVFYPKMKILVD